MAEDVLSPEQQALHNRLQTDLEFFSKKALKIKTKAGGLVPFLWNKPQRVIHDALERQLRETGRVRALILKARQEGCSTYVGARFYHKSTRQRNKSVFILSHEAQTTEKLFKIVERYHTHCPEPLKPPTRIANRREFAFETIGSDYSVGTAGNENVGRGGTIQFFHGSEVAFWENTDGIQTGIMQCVPDLPGTEIILESTANGMGNMFYEKCMEAMAGRGEYRLIFIPWFWMEEYSKPVPPDFALTPEEEDYRDLYKLTLEQMAWRRAKIEDFDNKLWKFQQEYPANPTEAFQTSGSNLIRNEAIMAARKSRVVDNVAPLVVGVDPSRNIDRCVIALRRGRQLFNPMVYSEMNEMRLAGIVAKLIDKFSPRKVFIDVGNGYGTIDRLREMGYGEFVVGVHFGEQAMESEVYRNKRTEMWINLRDWLQGGGVSIPDDDAIHADLACMPDYEETSNNIKFLKSKDEIKKKYGRSPDIGDAIALTFAYPVISNTGQTAKIRKVDNGNKGSLKTLRRMRSSDRQPGSSTTVFQR